MDNKNDEARKCPHCGKPAGKLDNFCRKCGKKISDICPKCRKFNEGKKFNCGKERCDN